MNKPIIAVVTALCLPGVTTSASAFCITGDPANGCALPFNGSTKSDGENTQQGFDAQTGNQWSTTSHKMGDFTFYSGVSSGNSWDGRQRFFGNSFNGSVFGSQNQASSPRCPVYGAC